MLSFRPEGKTLLASDNDNQPHLEICGWGIDGYVILDGRRKIVGRAVTLSNGARLLTELRGRA